jgi:hypothetical protein
MKQMKTLGRVLSKNEQKEILGGDKMQTTCVCTGSQNNGAAFFCISSNLSGHISCNVQGVSYCGGNATCATGPRV